MRPPKIHAFTLIELLTVIAIIAVLAAILFPVFARVKEAAKRTQCISQIRQVGLGLQLYLTDESDVFCPVLPKGTPTNGGANVWLPYDQQIWPYVKDDNIYTCPSDGIPVVSIATTDFYDGRYAKVYRKRSYAISGGIYTAAGQATVGAGAIDPNTGLSINSFTHLAVGRSSSEIQNPSDTVALVEVWAWVNGYSDSLVGAPFGSAFMGCDIGKMPGRNYPPASPDDQLPPECPSMIPPLASHTGRMNVLLIDNHTKPFTYSQLHADDYYLFKAIKP